MREYSEKAVHAFVEFIRYGHLNISDEQTVYDLADIFVRYKMYDGLASVNFWWMKTIHHKMCSEFVTSQYTTIGGVDGSFMQMMYRMSRKQKYDILLECLDGTKFQFHSLLLVAFSPYFLNLDITTNRAHRCERRVNLRQGDISMLYAFLYTFSRETDCSKMFEIISFLYDHKLLSAPHRIQPTEPRVPT